jgi:hypothetical protein
MVLPTALLLAAVVADAAVRCMAPDGPDGRTELLTRCLFPLVIAHWVLTDAQKRRLSLCYDFDSFLFFAYPVVGLAYLVRTRRWRAMLTLVWFLLIILVPNIVVALIAALIR